MSQKLKFTLIGLLSLFIAAAVAWNLSGSSFTGIARQFIQNTAANSINGTLSIGDVDFSLPGSLTARKLELKDKAGVLVASAQSLSIDLDMTDLLGHRLDIDRIRKVSLEGLIVHLNRDKDGLWNVVETLRKTPAGTPPPAIFRGQVVAKDAAVTISTTEALYDFKKVDAALDFAKYPDIALDLKSKDNPAELAAKGTWNFNTGGNVTGSANGVEPAHFSPNIPVKGPATTTFTLAGTTEKPTAQGSFKIPAGMVGNIAFSEAIGEFSFVDGTLNLSGTRAGALGGSITASGPLALDTLFYSQKVSGQNIDSSQLSDRDIQGRIHFTADVQGQGSGDSRADGTFSMGAGTISGIPVDALTGNFSKRGINIRYYNLRATIGGQTIYIGDADSLEALKQQIKVPELRNIPIPKIPEVPAIPGLPKLPSLPRLF